MSSCIYGISVMSVKCSAISWFFLENRERVEFLLNARKYHVCKLHGKGIFNGLTENDKIVSFCVNFLDTGKLTQSGTILSQIDRKIIVTMWRKKAIITQKNFRQKMTFLCQNLAKSCARLWLVDILSLYVEKTVIIIMSHYGKMEIIFARRVREKRWR